jgi:hypothetical protein
VLSQTYTGHNNRGDACHVVISNTPPQTHRLRLNEREEVLEPSRHFIKISLRLRVEEIQI